MLSFLMAKPPVPAVAKEVSEFYEIIKRVDSFIICEKKLEKYGDLG